MTKLTTFTFNAGRARRMGEAAEHTIRVLEDERGEGWLVMPDVCRAVGIHIRANGEVHTANVTRLLDADEFRKVAPYPIWGMRHSVREVTLISKSGLYKLILRSDKPAAKPFIDWVTKVVLPTIEKTGEFSVKASGQPSPKLPFVCSYAGTIKDLKELGRGLRPRPGWPFRSPSCLS